MTTHAFRHEPRIKRTDQQFAKIFLDRGGRCHVCTRRLGSGIKYQFDHIIALEDGGTDDDSNIAPCCEVPCHRDKTKSDHGKAAKIRDLAVSHVIPPSRRQKKGKPLPGTKRSGWRHRMDGTWERR